MKHLLFFLLAVPCSAFSVTATSSIPTQAILSYECAGTATIVVSESNTLSPVVHDVDPALFPGSNLDSRPGTLTSGARKVVVVGKRTIDLASDSKKYSRALQQGTTHYYSVTCGATTVTGSFTTKVYPFGATYSDLPPVNPDGTPNFPSWDMTNRSETMVDPQFGTLIRHLNLLSDDADLGYNCGGPHLCYNQGSANGMGQYCADTIAPSGVYLCLGGQQSGGGSWPDLYAVNPTTGNVAFLGHAYVAKYDIDGVTSGSQRILADSGELMPFYPGSYNTAYVLASYNCGNTCNKTTIVKWVYNGDYTSPPSGTSFVAAPYVGQGMGAASGIDMLSGQDLNTLIHGFNPAYDNTVFGCGEETVQAGYLLFNCRYYQQGSYDWIGAYNLGNQLPLGSGGNGAVAALTAVFAQPETRWCTDHGVVFNSETSAIALESPGGQYGGLGAGPTQVVLGTNMPANTNSITVSVSSASLVGTHYGGCTDTWTTPAPPYTNGEPVSPCAPHFLQAAATGDLMQFPNGEAVIITKHSPTSWTLTRAQASTPAQAHYSGDMLSEVCKINANPVVAGIAFTYWNFVSSPTGTEHAGDYTVGVGNHSALRGNYNVQGESGSWSFFNSPVSDQSQWGLAYPYAITATPTFSGFTADGGAFQRHPSIASNGAPYVFDSTAFGGEYPTFGGNTKAVTAQVTCSPTCHNVWSYDYSIGTTGVNPKIVPILAVTCGDNTNTACQSRFLTDVSAPGKVLSDSDPDYVYCIPNVNGECAIGSTTTGKKAYFKMSTFDYNNGWCQGTENYIASNQNICIGNFAAGGMAALQAKFVNDPTGGDGSQYRPLSRTWGMVGGTPETLKLTYGMEWAMIYPLQNATGTDYTSTVNLLKIPPDPGSDGIDRTKFVPAVLSLTPPSGIGVTQAQVKFWYVEQGGSITNPYCTSRREGCVAVSATINPANPFSYVTTDSYVPAPCSTSCTITVPVLPLHTAYYSAEYLDADGDLLMTTQGVAAENEVIMLRASNVRASATTLQGGTILGGTIR